MHFVCCYCCIVQYIIYIYIWLLKKSLAIPCTRWPNDTNQCRSLPNRPWADDTKQCWGLLVTVHTSVVSWVAHSHLLRTSPSVSSPRKPCSDLDLRVWSSTSVLRKWHKAGRLALQTPSDTIKTSKAVNSASFMGKISGKDTVCTCYETLTLWDPLNNFFLTKE